jgi:hypothetical protein
MKAEETNGDNPLKYQAYRGGLRVLPLQSMEEAFFRCAKPRARAVPREVAVYDNERKGP